MHSYNELETGKRARNSYAVATPRPHVKKTDRSQRKQKQNRKVGKHKHLGMLSAVILKESKVRCVVQHVIALLYEEYSC